MTNVAKSITHDEIIKATIEDEELQELIRRIRGVKTNAVKRKSQAYDAIFHELSVTNENVVLRQNNIVIPSSLRERVISIAHDGHQGKSKTKSLLRTKVWFPGLDKMVDDFIEKCQACEINQPKTYFEPLQMSKMPESPCCNVAIDFYGPTPSNTKLLVLYDEYSRYAIIEEISSERADVVIPILHKICMTIGIPATIKSDNGPPFTSQDFSKFCLQYGINHRLITPYWPRANGEVERFNKNIKKAIKNASATNTNWLKEVYNFLGSYLATPHCSTGIPPAQLILKFNNTTRLINLNNKREFEKSSIDQQAIQNDLQSKSKMEKYGNQHLEAKESQLKIGQHVLYEEPKRAFKGKHKTKRVVDTFVITQIKGTMITAKSINTNKIVTRNSSCFKPTKAGAYAKCEL